MHISPARELYLSYLSFYTHSQVISPQAFLGGVRFGSMNGRIRSMPRPGPELHFGGRVSQGIALCILYISTTCVCRDMTAVWRRRGRPRTKRILLVAGDISHCCHLAGPGSRLQRIRLSGKGGVQSRRTARWGSEARSNDVRGGPSSRDLEMSSCGALFFG
jgi:hypothetical protein